MYFTEIFHLESSIHEGHKDLRIDYDAMLRIFLLVSYKPPQKLLREFQKKFREGDGTMNFQTFVEVFSLKQHPDFNEIDAKNSFRLLSREYDKNKSNMISIFRCQQILEEMGFNEEEKEIMTAQLEIFAENGEFNFETFLRLAFWRN